MISKRKLKPDTRILPSGPNIEALKGLANLVCEQPVAMVGAGMSFSLGFPSWKALIEMMDHALDSFKNEYREVLRGEEDLLWRAAEYRRMMDKVDGSVYPGLIGRVFGKKIEVDSDDLNVKLVRLPFRHFITTNYDDVILEAHKKAGKPEPAVLTWGDKDVREFIFGLRNTERRSILHLHGRHSEPDSIVLSDDDYTTRYVRTFGTTPKLFAIFSTERVVFVGFSLTDPDLMELLREVNATMQSTTPRHFAIMQIADRNRELLERSKLVHRYGVEPVFYDSSGNDHTGLDEILELLQQEVDESADKDSGKSSVRRRQPLKPPSLPPVSDPEDPEKGRWGGEPKQNGRKITADVEELEPDWFRVTMTVRSTTKKNPLEGDVVFHLHPTMIPSVRRARAKDGVATLVAESYGAYTVGVEADNGKTHLELDLSEIESAPLMFRIN